MEKGSNGMMPFSFGRQFQAFLNYNRPLLNPVTLDLDEDAYVESFRSLIEEVGRVVMSLHITF